MNFSEYLKSWMDENGLSARAVDRLTGISHSYIGYILKGKKPNGEKPNISIDKYRKFAKAMGFNDVNELFALIDDDVQWGTPKKNKVSVKAKAEEDSILEAYSRATYEEKKLVYYILGKYGMTEPVQQEGRSSENSSDYKVG